MTGDFKISVAGINLSIERGEWVVKNDLADFAPIEDRKTVSMLPLLELPIKEIQESLRLALERNGLSDEYLSQFPFEEIIKRALNWPTEYWVGLAIGWIEDLDSADEYQELLRKIFKNVKFSQALRHRIKRISKRFNPPLKA